MTHAEFDQYFNEALKFFQRIIKDIEAAGRVTPVAQLDAARQIWPSLNTPKA